MSDGTGDAVGPVGTFDIVGCEEGNAETLGLKDIDGMNEGASDGKGDAVGPVGSLEIEGDGVGRNVGLGSPDSGGLELEE